MSDYQDARKYLSRTVASRVTSAEATAYDERSGFSTLTKYYGRVPSSKLGLVPTVFVLEAFVYDNTYLATCFCFSYKLVASQPFVLMNPFISSSKLVNCCLAIKWTDDATGITYRYQLTPSASHFFTPYTNQLIGATAFIEVWAESLGLVWTTSNIFLTSGIIQESSDLNATEIDITPTPVSRDAMVVAVPVALPMTNLMII